MARYWALALMAVLPLCVGVTQAGGKKDGEYFAKDRLTKDDPRDKRRNAAHKIHTGKVVLLNFWDVKSASSAAALPRLREWHEKLKGQGLEVVGVTFYNSELGQKYAFDKESGKAVKADDASKESDQALMKEFAEHHKLDFLLLTLNKAEALR